MPPTNRRCGSAFAHSRPSQDNSAAPADPVLVPAEVASRFSEKMQTKRGRVDTQAAADTATTADHGTLDSEKRSSGRVRREPVAFRSSKTARTQKKMGAFQPKMEAAVVTAPPSNSKQQKRKQNTKEDTVAVVPIAPENLELPLSSIMGNLRGAGTGTIVGREQEQRTIASFLESTVGMKQSGALYVSGRPGCGKTLSVRAAADLYRRKSKVVVLNGMSLVDGARDLFSEILKTLCPAALKEKMDAEMCLRQMFTGGGKKRHTLLVLDEMDALLESGCEQSVLAALFSWTQLPGSTLVLIGIANALDLTHRFLPILHAKNCAPQLLTFTPYTEHDLLSILRQRLRFDPSRAPAESNTRFEDVEMPEPSSPCSQASVQTVVAVDTHIKFEVTALDLCARRIAAESGDTRKAMEACREAAKAVVRAAPISLEPDAVLVVGIGVMAKTLSNLLVNNHKVSDQRLKDLPLHQALLLCAVVLGGRAGHHAHTEADLLNAYLRVCHKHSLPPLPANQVGEVRGALCDIGVLKATSVGKGKKMYVINVKDAVVQSSLQNLPVYSKILLDAARCSALSMC